MMQFKLKAFPRLSIPSLCGMFVYRPTTSILTGKAPGVKLIDLSVFSSLINERVFLALDLLNGGQQAG
jgi:hypothetical protein